MRIPKLSLHASGWLFVRLNGKPKYLSKNKTEAESLYREILAQHFSPVQVPAMAGVTTGELLERYKAAQLEACQPRWRRDRGHILRQSQAEALRLYSHLPAVHFGPKCFQTVRKSMVREGRCRAYVNGLCGKLRSAWKWGVGEELVPVATYQALKCVPDLKPGEMGLEDHEERQPVDSAIVAKTLEFLNDRAADLVRLLLLTAARPDEVVRLKPEHIVKHADGTWTFIPRQHKTSKANKKRLIVWNDECKTILSKYLLKTKPGAYLFQADIAQIAEGSEPHYRVSSLLTAVKRACHRAGVECWVSYSLRHAKLTQVSLEHGPEFAQALGGHSTVAMTAHYDHGQLQRVKKAVG